MRVAIDIIGLACCGLEAETAMAFMDDAIAVDGVIVERFVSGATPDLTIAVVAGTVTAAVAADVRQRIAGLPEPRAVMAYGVCAASGGPYWDSYSVTQGIDTPSLLVPGCPPRPEALQAAVLRLVEEAHHATR